MHVPTALRSGYGSKSTGGLKTNKPKTWGEINTWCSNLKLMKATVVWQPSRPFGFRTRPTRAAGVKCQGTSYSFVSSPTHLWRGHLLQWHEILVCRAKSFQVFLRILLLKRQYCEYCNKLYRKAKRIHSPFRLCTFQTVRHWQCEVSAQCKYARRITMFE